MVLGLKVFKFIVQQTSSEKKEKRCIQNLYKVTQSHQNNFKFYRIPNIFSYDLSLSELP